jgi:hypothetical protein
MKRGKMKKTIINVRTVIMLIMLAGNTNAIETNVNERGDFDRTVMICYVGWHPLLGKANGEKLWQSNAFNWETQKNSKRIKNFPLQYGLDIPAEASVFGSEAYRKTTRECLVKETEAIKNCNIDVIVYDDLVFPKFDSRQPLSWTNVPINRFETFQEFARQAEKVGLKVALSPEIRVISADYPPPNGYVMNLQEIVNLYDYLYDSVRSIPSYYRIDNKPVFMPFHTDCSHSKLTAPNPNAPLPDCGWREILDLLKNREKSIYFIADIYLTQWTAEWSKIASAAYAFVPACPTEFYIDMHIKCQERLTIPYIWSISPGYDSTHFKGYTRNDFTRIHAMYMAALTNGAKTIYILTWNDLAESTDIFPSDYKGYCLYNVFKFYNEWFKTDRRPKLQEDKIYICYPLRIPDEVTSTALKYGPTSMHEEAYSPKIYYWAYTSREHTLEIKNAGRITLPEGLSMGEFQSIAKTGEVTCQIDDKTISLPNIRRIEKDKKWDDSSGGLEYQYIDVLKALNDKSE